MNNAIGKVQSIGSKEGQYGTMWSVKIDGTYYGAGKYPPKCKEGDTIEFVWTAKGNFKNLDPKSIKIAEAPVYGQQAPAQSAAPQRSSFGDDRQDTISKQAACNTAIAFVELLRQAEAVPGIKKTATADDKYDIYSSLVAKKIEEFYELNTGKKLVVPRTSATIPEEGAEDEQWA